MNRRPAIETGQLRQRPSPGTWDTLQPAVRELLMEIKAHYHYRTGLHHDDGSMGEIRITPRELLDALATAYLDGYFDGVDDR